MGFEPTTASLEGWNSTTELRPQLPIIPTPAKTAYASTTQMLYGGQARIRTLEADGSRFTVCPRCPLGYLPAIIFYNQQSETGKNLHGGGIVGHLPTDKNPATLEI